MNRVKGKKLALRTAMSWLLVAGIGYGFSEKGLDLAGDLAHELPPAELKNKAYEYYSDSFKRLSPAAKLAVQYAGASIVNEGDLDRCNARVQICSTGYGSDGSEFSIPSRNNGSGILGFISTFDSEEYVAIENSKCLYGTGYDTTSEDNHILPFDSKNNNSVATINPLSNGKITVTPASGVGDSLVFIEDNSSGKLLPDPESNTKDILEAYGCKDIFNKKFDLKIE